jgi:predicted 3-demethylubiquinone-9 3-methyltransferase (glyoxalase superfamily)
MEKQKLTPFLWFEKDGEEAAKYYCSIFKNSKILESNPMVTAFEIDGLRLNILNGGPQFKLNESFSIVVNCETQEEIDTYWNKFIADGGSESMCGWLKDKYGVSWQIVPSNIGTLITDPSKGQRAVQAMMQMKKLDIKKLTDA